MYENMYDFFRNSSFQPVHIHLIPKYLAIVISLISELHAN